MGKSWRKIDEGIQRVGRERRKGRINNRGDKYRKRKMEDSGGMVCNQIYKEKVKLLIGGDFNARTGNKGGK